MAGILRLMAISVSDTTQAMTAALKDSQRLETPEVRRKDKEPVTQAVAKSVAVSISVDAKMQVLKDTLK